MGRTGRTPGENVAKPALRVMHSDLERFSPGDSAFKSCCPSCQHGLLPVRRDRETKSVSREDSCLFCGQKFLYADASIAGEELPAGAAA